MKGRRLPLTNDRHNEEVAALWEAYARAENKRVPIVFAADESLWLKLAEESFRRFYTDPRTQLEVSLRGAAWFAANVVGDQNRGSPEVWSVGPRFWMDESEFFGCEVVIQEDTFAWSKPLPGAKGELLRRLADIEPVARVKATRLWTLWEGMKELAEGMTWEGRDVTVGAPGGGTHGIFTVACHLRGVEALCLDLVEDPGFAREFLGLVTEKTIGKIKAWNALTGTGAEYPNSGGWGMADDSIQLLSAETYRMAVLPHHERVYSAMTTGARSMHLCGYSMQHFPTLYDELAITALDGPGPFVDHGALLREMPKLSISGQVDHTVLLLGPALAIEEMMRGVLTDEAKQPGRLSLLGYVGPETSLENTRLMYEAGKKFGVVATPQDARPRAAAPCARGRSGRRTAT